jgi:hypothetical protein
MDPNAAEAGDPTAATPTSDAGPSGEHHGASLGLGTSSGATPTVPEETQREGDRPSEEAVLSALANRDCRTSAPAASVRAKGTRADPGTSSGSESEDSSSNKRKSKKHKKEKKSKKLKKEKKSKKSSSKKHKKEKKHKKKRKREKDSAGSSSGSDSGEEDNTEKGPVQLSDFMKGSSRTKDDGERYSSVSGLKIANSYTMSEYDKEQVRRYFPAEFF